MDKQNPSSMNSAQIIAHTKKILRFYEEEKAKKEKAKEEARLEQARRDENTLARANRNKAREEEKAKREERSK